MAKVEVKEHLAQIQTEKAVITILEMIERHLHSVENVVACYRAEYDEAQRLKRHFLNADMSTYFPKKLTEPVIFTEYQLPDGEYVKFMRRTYSWITEYWRRPSQAKSQKVLLARRLTPDDELIHAAVIREKNQ